MFNATEYGIHSGGHSADWACLKQIVKIIHKVYMCRATGLQTQLLCQVVLYLQFSNILFHEVDTIYIYKRPCQFTLWINSHRLVIFSHLSLIKLKLCDTIKNLIHKYMILKWLVQPLNVCVKTKTTVSWWDGSDPDFSRYCGNYMDINIAEY